MDINKLTSQFQQDLNAAQSLAINKNHTAIEGVHVLSSMLSDYASSVSNVLNELNVNTVIYFIDLFCINSPLINCKLVKINMTNSFFFSVIN
jgi:ATP-dependent Clp protease ATP-binding subunit ClpB